MSGLSFPEAQLPASLNKLGKVLASSDFNETLVEIISLHDFSQQEFGGFSIGDELRMSEGIGDKITASRLFDAVKLALRPPMRPSRRRHQWSDQTNEMHLTQAKYAGQHGLEMPKAGHGSAILIDQSQ